MDSKSIIFLSAESLAAKVKSKEISPTEVVKAYLEQIELLNPQINAYITVMADEALAEAHVAEQKLISGENKGALFGVPIGVKDQIHTKGIPTTSASKIKSNFVPISDATVVNKLKKSGGIILGKLNMTEFAMGDPITSAYGITHNPWDLDRSPGTSSTGSGAATASFMCATSLGEDTGGSIRGPAANCGLVGIRPTWGRVSRFGVDGASWSLDTIGPISRTVKDCALTLGSIAGHDLNDPRTSKLTVPDYVEKLTGEIKGIRIGLIKEFLDPDIMGLDHRLRQGILDSVDVLSDLGAEVEEISIPLSPYSGAASRTISAVERSSLHPEWLRNNLEELHPNTRIAFTAGELIPAQIYYKAQKLRTLIRKQTTEALKDFDILAMPVDSGPAQIMNLTPGVPSKESADRAIKNASYRGLFSLVSCPALSVCCGFADENGKKLPLGLQLAGRPFDEAKLLNVAYSYEQNTEWHTRKPPL